MDISRRMLLTPNVAAALVILAALWFGTIPAAAQSADGPATFHGNPSRTGEQPGPGPSGDPTAAWRFQTQDAVRSSPVIADGVVYVGSNDGSLYALDAETGEERWRFVTGGPITGSAAIAESVVYFGSGDGYAYAIDAATGEERWRFFAAELNVDIARVPNEDRDRGTLSTSVAVVDGLVYVSSNSFKVTAIDAATGIERWHTFSNGPDVTTPTVDDGNLYFASDEGIYAVEADTGRDLWRAVFDPDLQGGESAPEESPTGESDTADETDDETAPEEPDGSADEGVPEDSAETTGEGEAADARQTGVLDAEGGEEIPLATLVSESFDGFTWDITAAPVAAGDQVFAVVYGTKGGGDGEAAIVTSALISLNPESGNVTGWWSFYAWKPILATAAVVSGTAFVGVDQGLLYAYNIEENVERWAVQTESFIASAPAVTQDTVFFGNDDGRVYALASDSGQERWRFETGGAVRSSPLVVNGLVYVGSDDGYVYAIGGS